MMYLPLRDLRFLSTADPEWSILSGQQFLFSVNRFSPCPCMSGRSSDVRLVRRIFIFVVAHDVGCVLFGARPFDLAKYRATMSNSRTFAEY